MKKVVYFLGLFALFLSITLFAYAQRGKLESKDGPLNLDTDKLKLVLDVVDIDSLHWKIIPKISITDLATNQQALNTRVEIDSAKNSVVFLPFEKKYSLRLGAEEYIDTMFTVDVLKIEEYDVYKQIKLRPKKRRRKINLADIDEDGAAVVLINKRTNERVELKPTQNKGEYEVDLRDTDEYELEITNANKTAKYYRSLTAKTKKTNLLGANPEDVEMVVGQKIPLIYAEFAYNSAELSEKVQYQLKRIAHNISKDEKIKVEIAAHTDNIGSYERNMALSQERANAVFNFLVNECKVPAKQLIPKGYGYTKPLLSNDNEWNRSRNRRFELIVIEK
ncbi:MAG: OmpA family protein [Microscillaceae bacterium]|nr:OmpA family protein [Microscillaceae bacterium]MDW8461117.1 OmpA family protein [Cytophagales bacterium]